MTAPSKVEGLKESSGQLRGTLASDLLSDAPTLSGDMEQIIKHHGAYQQDHRDRRKSGAREHSFLVRTRLPGGRLTSAQLLAELDLCERYGNGTLRITDRQGLQLHGVAKRDLRAVIRGIHAEKLSTFGACGDVVRNIMCCPAPLKAGGAIRQQMQRQLDALAGHFALRSRAYYEIWLQEGEESTLVPGLAPEPATDEEPLYGAAYLPRKFKFAFALPEDNCVDALTHDVGFVALPGSEDKPYFNVYVGGGMGVTPARADTFPAVAQPLAIVSSQELLPLADAIVQLYRGQGNRSDRKRARLKYLLADWGIERFRAELETVYGRKTVPAEPLAITNIDDHLGWHEQPDGRLFLGLRVESGRIQDQGTVRMKSALRAVAAAFPLSVRLTPLQDLLLCGLEPAWRDPVEQILREHGVPFEYDVPLTSRLAIACPALPTCGLAITESERAMPDLLRALRQRLKELHLQEERISIRMTGCPNGCTRPYVAEVGVVGKAVDRYTLFVGGSPSGTRLAFKLQDMLSRSQVIETLGQLWQVFATDRTAGEPFGDFCARVGAEVLLDQLATTRSSTP